MIFNDISIALNHAGAFPINTQDKTLIFFDLYNTIGEINWKNTRARS